MGSGQGCEHPEGRTQSPLGSRGGFLQGRLSSWVFRVQEGVPGRDSRASGSTEMRGGECSREPAP